jgi:hypothetical protein
VLGALTHGLHHPKDVALMVIAELGERLHGEETVHELVKAGVEILRAKR